MRNFILRNLVPRLLRYDLYSHCYAHWNDPRCTLKNDKSLFGKIHDSVKQSTQTSKRHTAGKGRQNQSVHNILKFIKTVLLNFTSP